MKLRIIASGSLATGGLLLIGIGIYFAFLRPALLPEDANYIGASIIQIEGIGPGMMHWLGRVFDVLGGFIFAAGLLTVYVALTSFRTGTGGSAWIAAVSGLASIGWMAITNFILDSDFKWVLLALTLPWMIALLLLAASHLVQKVPDSG